MSLPQKWTCLLASLTAAVWLAAAVAQPPKKDDKKKEVPPTKEELEQRQGSKDLMYKFNVGEELHAEARFKRVEHKMIQDKRAQDTQEATLKLILSVDSVSPNGDAEITARVDQVIFSRSGRIFKKFDTHKPELGQEAEGWELFVDAKFKFKVDSRGNISNIRPDAETDHFWKSQHKVLRSLVSDDAVRALLPFMKLPTDLARVGTDWNVVKSFDDETFGTREVKLELSYRGNETISGQTYEYIRVRGDAKLLETKPKYEIVEYFGEGAVRFDLRRGHMRNLRYTESYLFNPPGAPLVGGEKESGSSEKSIKGGRAGSGAGPPPGSGGGGYPGSGGASDDPRAGKGKGKKTKEERDKEKEKKSEDKSIVLEIEYETRVNYRGKPISAQ